MRCSTPMMRVSANGASLTMKKFAGLQQGEVLAIILKRGALIFLCGYLLYWFPFITPQGTLSAVPTTNRKDGNTRSVSVKPCQAACSSGP